MAIGFTLSFQNKEFRGLTRAQQTLRAAALEAVDATHKQVLDKADMLVPVDTGDLKRSRRLDPAYFNGDRIVSRGGYGDDSKTNAYALIQHEDLTLNHPRGGQAKFYSQPFFEMFGEMKVLIAMRINARMK